MMDCTIYDLPVSMDDFTTRVLTANSSDGGIVGFAELSQLDSEFVWIDRLFVDPKHRRVGVGSSLIATIKRFASVLGKGVCLGVKCTNEVAIKFYEKVGFRRVYQYADRGTYMYGWSGDTRVDGTDGVADRAK